MRVGQALGEPLDHKKQHAVFPPSVFQRGEAWMGERTNERGNRCIAGRPTFVPENLRNKWRFEPAMPTHPMSKQVRLDASLARLENSKHNTSLVRTKFFARKTTTDNDAQNFALIGGRLEHVLLRPLFQEQRSRELLSCEHVPVEPLELRRHTEI